MNPHASHPSSALSMLKTLWKNRNLIYQLTKREIAGRYKGSIFGLAWSFFNPLLLLTIYTFVFSYVFKARWNINTDHNKAEFALVLFVGLILHSFLAEILSRAPTQLMANVNYIKKVVFPLEILAVVNLFSALFHMCISFIVLLLAQLITSGTPPGTVFLAPLTIGPIIPFVLGTGWMLSSLGVFVRDIAQFIGLIVTALMFLAPIFYPITALPEQLQGLFYLNPLTIPIEQTRNVMIFGLMPEWHLLVFYLLASLAMCILGYWFFQKTRKGFADVL